MKEQLQAEIEQKKKELAELEAKLAALPAKTPEERLLELLKSCTRLNVHDRGWIWYNDEGKWMLELKDYILWVNCHEVWYVLKSKYQMDDGHIQSLIKDVMEKHYKFSGVTPAARWLFWNARMENHYKF